MPVEYRMNELSMTLPGAGWIDRTCQTLHLPAPDGTSISLEIARHDPVAPESLGERVDGDLLRSGRLLRGFELVSRQDFQTAAVHGVAVSYRTVSVEGAVHHEIAYLPLAEVLMVFTIRGRIVHAAACHELLGQAIGTLKLR
jgi:hypothetical protein